MQHSLSNVKQKVKPVRTKLHKNNNASTNSLKYSSNKTVNVINDYLEKSAIQRCLGKISYGREEAFESFKQNSSISSDINDAKLQLKGQYEKAKSLGSKIVILKHNIQDIKNDLIDCMEARHNPNRVERLRERLEIDRTDYKNKIDQLKLIKREIEHGQRTLEAWKIRLVKDFDTWWNRQCEMDIVEENTSITSAAENPQLDLTSVNKNHVQEEPKVSSPEVTSSSINNESIHCSIDELKLINKTYRVNEASQQVPLTGDSAVDADILEFMRTRQRFRRNRC